MLGLNLTLMCLESHINECNGYGVIIKPYRADVVEALTLDRKNQESPRAEMVWAKYFSKKIHVGNTKGHCGRACTS